MAFYSDMATMARGLLASEAQGGFGQGIITITRRTLDPAANSWDDPTVTETIRTVDGVVRGIDTKLVGTPTGEGGPVLLASDRVALCAPPVDYRAGDVLTIDGKAVLVLQVENIPAAGLTAAVRFIVRG